MRRRPAIIWILGFAFIFSPLANILMNAQQFDLSALVVLKSYDITGLALLITSPVVGFGILRVRRWGFYAFLIFALANISHNIFTLVTSTQTYHVIILIQSAVLLMVAFYFLQKNITRVYLSEKKRGFRFNHRKAIEQSIFIDGQEYQSIDFSKTGLSLAWPNCQHPIGHEVSFSLNNEDIFATIVRKDDEKVGLKII